MEELHTTQVCPAYLELEKTAVAVRDWRNASTLADAADILVITDPTLAELAATRAPTRSKTSAVMRSRASRASAIWRTVSEGVRSWETRGTWYLWRIREEDDILTRLTRKRPPY